MLLLQQTSINFILGKRKLLNIFENGGKHT